MPAQAEDHVQEFFALLLEKNYLARVNRVKGKFRSSLLGSLKHFPANEYDKDRALQGGLFLSHNALLFMLC